VLWLDPSFGASGDMLLGVLADLGVDMAEVAIGLEGLGVHGWSLGQSKVTRCGLSATRVEVYAEHGSARRWSEIDELIAAADLPAPVRDGARATFRRLGDVEAAAHDIAIEQVHFHEVGAIDAIVDIVGVWSALDLLDVERVIAGPVGLGHGTVTGAHGVLPLPAPATAALLVGAPVRPLDVELETCTPTGAALLTTIAEWGPMPAGTLVGSARGAGGRDPVTHPNIVTAHLIAEGSGQPEGSEVGDPSGGTSTAAVVLSTNLDDVTPEVLGYTVELLLAAGADDAWIVPIVMKKSRPAFQLCALSTPDRAEALRAVISAETGTLGIREESVAKHIQPRHVVDVDVDGVLVRVKVGPDGAKPEYDDLVALAATTGRPLRELSAEVLRRWLAR
jgi:uncharacterized protein (TIGR00299 family) protein